ncbi:Major Facilitator Superfamily (MFS) [Phytophthora infestans T30-4]|uniref:Hexose transporter 1 n=1 Tax=Phytophthora infestans (strain T30-4) TaxID=403677 RepID=D0RLX6_PHYIT|nr:Major Facilitator Superfamily (MFS) [Phytophthora infestans T30-4]EEY55106.1 Major Facilitator Superfamily (MFS) [Phytophthora infestans T30-4]|eukprot:XP_002909954.1 Major Facilitator Superfamily (MFS) [Phytophthora infestans T30-4]
MADYTEAATPKTGGVTAFDEANKAAARLIKPKAILYTTALLSWMQPFQSGWSTSQMNLSQYNDTDECNARPVAEDTCLMFPGHSKLEWTFAVNAWIFGAMVGSLCCGLFSDKYGRKKALMGNCIFMIVGGVVQASVSNVWLFALGRLIAGISSGTATATIGGYINELSPPHMRNTLGLGLQIFTTIGILVPAICFFFANTSSGWRYLAALPVVLAVVYLLLAPTMCIESPAWLLNQGRKEEAKQVIARLYGEEHVQTALSWLEVSKGSAEEGLIDSTPKQESMFNPRYRMQLLCGILLSSSSQNAGISDSRVGTLIIDFINIFPAFFTGVLAHRFGARNMILWGLSGMVVMSIGMTVAFIVDVSALSIVFTALYVIVFGVTLGPLVWVMTADIFPDSIRASASSLCIGINWLCNLIVGVSYPYISDALDDYAYVPFVVLLAIFYLLALKLVPETSGKSAEEIQAEYDSRCGQVERRR